MTTQIEVRERPILFSGHMVRAILDGRKTQTRRVIKPQPDYLWHDDPCSNDKGYISCPYGKSGDRLWVRESFWLQTDLGLPSTEPQPIAYTADGNTQCLEDYKQKPSIFMPRWASRITLEITGVRVERIDQISVADIEAEGTPLGLAQSQWNDGYARVQDFKVLWNSINEKRGYGWDTKSWVWVVEFKRVGQ